jgi:hypothetical protein
MRERSLSVVVTGLLAMTVLLAGSAVLLPRAGASGSPRSAPVNKGEPVITGTVALGRTLSTSEGRWSGSPKRFSYQWQDCTRDGRRCSNIAGARSRRYTVARGDAGHTIKAIVTATSAAASRAADAPIVPLIDNFTRDRRIDRNVWYAPDQQGDTSNGEVECYRPSQLRLDNKRGLRETIRYVPAGFTCPSGTRNSSNPLYYESGAVQMKSVSFTYGTVVARMKMSGAGTWPVLWLLGASCQTPNWLTDGPNATGFACPWPADTSDAAEIDIAEHNTSSKNMLENVYNSSAGVSHACTDNVGSDVSAGYHTYELDWSPGLLVFKVDGAVTGCGVSGDGVPSQPMFLIIDTAACTVNACGQTPDNSALLQSTSIEYVHISH